MADSRFFTGKGPFTLKELAAAAGAELADIGNAGRKVNAVAPLDRAGPQDISFLDNTKYLEDFAASRAGACIVHPKHADRAPRGMALLLAEEPYQAYAAVAQHFFPAPPVMPGIHASAQIDASASVAESASIGPGAVIEAGAEIGERSRINANTVIGAGVSIGDDCRIGANATIQYSLIGDRVILHPGVCIGQDGFGFAMSGAGHQKVPQLGRVIIEDDVEIGAGTCIDRGSGPDTVIGAGTKIDNLVQIGHNCQIGRGCIIVSQVGLSGSTRLGDFVVMGGQAATAGHLSVAPGSRFAARSGIVGDIPDQGTYGGFPAVPVREWHRQTATLARIAKNKKRKT